MRHHHRQRSLGRDKDERLALLRNLAQSLIEHGKIVTTEAKAKELRPFVEKLVTYAKKDTLASRRQILSVLGQPKSDIAKKLGEISATHKERNGGYTRIIKMGRTKAGRDEAVIEFVA